MVDEAGNQATYTYNFLSGGNPTGASLATDNPGITIGGVSTTTGSVMENFFISSGTRPCATTVAIAAFGGTIRTLHRGEI